MLGFDDARQPLGSRPSLDRLQIDQALPSSVSVVVGVTGRLHGFDLGPRVDMAHNQGNVVINSLEANGQGEIDRSVTAGS